MRKYFQSLGRALYARATAQSKARPSSVDPKLIHTPLPSAPEKQRESLSDIVKWQSICLALQGVSRYLDAHSKLQYKSSAPELNLNVSFPPHMEAHSESTTSKETIMKEDDDKRMTIEAKSVYHGSTYDELFTTTSRAPYRPNNRITVVGSSDLGMATVFSLLAKGVTNDISMVDFSERKLRGELMDFQSGSKFIPNARLRASKDFAISTDSKICILTPCSDVASGDRPYECVRCHAEVLKAIVPKLLEYSPDCVILVALDPVDVLSYVAWRASSLPKGRVFGTGTNLSSATFRYLLADRLGISPSSCNGFIIGENGRSSVPVWSGVSAGGVLLKDLNPDIGTDSDFENWQEVHRQVVESGQCIRDLKGSNSWASALSITDICSAILNDTNNVRPLSTYVKGEHNIEEEVFMSLPCVLGAEGITDLVRQPLTGNEMEQLHKSAEVVACNLGTIKIPSES